MRWQPVGGVRRGVQLGARSSGRRLQLLAFNVALPLQTPCACNAMYICCADIEERIARWTLLPAGNGEGLQVLLYGPTQKYGKPVP